MATIYTDDLVKLGRVVLSGRLFDRAKLIKPVSNVRPSVHTYVRLYVRSSIRPQKVSSISMKFGM